MKKNETKHVVFHKKTEEGIIPWLEIAAPSIAQINAMGENSEIDRKHVLAVMGGTGNESLFHAFVINCKESTCDLVILDALECVDPLMESDTWHVSVDIPALPLREMLVKDIEVGTIVIVAGTVAIATTECCEECKADDPCLFAKLSEPETLITKPALMKIWVVDMDFVDILEYKPQILTS